MYECPTRTGVQWGEMVEGGQGGLGFVAFVHCSVIDRVAKVFGSTGKGCMLLG